MAYKRLALRAALIALFVAGLVGFGVRGALAATSHVSPSAVESDTTTLYWSGQGAPVSQQCGSSADPGSGGYQNGASATSYMLWIFTTDAASTTPTLVINGVSYGAAHATSSSTWQIVTPYIDPATITPADKTNQSSTGTAYTTFTVSSLGKGAWGLKISHGCGGSTASTPTISKTAVGSYDNTYAWTVTKGSDTDTVYSAGGGPSGPANYTVDVSHDGGTISNVKVTGQITVSNPNTDAIAITGATDALSDNTACTITDQVPSSLPHGNTTLNYECELNALPAGALENTATVSWDAQTLPDDGALKAGSTSFTTPPISFKANTIDSCITVSDPLDLTGPHKYCVGDNGDPNFSFGYQATFKDPNGTCSTDQNTATGVTSDTKTVVDSNTVTVTDCQGADLTVTKSATPSFTRTYTWGIAKAVDKPQVDTSGSATFNYTVTVTHDNGADSDWAVNGVITVTNPNDWEAVTANVTDAVNNGGTCTVTGGTGVSVPASSSVQLPYTCTYATAPDPVSGTNTATATWDQAAAHTTHSSSTGTAPADFSTATPKIVDGTVSVSDTLGGTLGTVNFTDPSPTTFTYPLTFTDPAGTCTTHDNTATFTTSDTGTTGNSSQSVTVCVGADLLASKTASTSFTRTYGWSILKNVDKTKVTIDPWASANFSYTVSVSHDNGTDSAFGVAGTITVSNPNDWEAIKGVNVGDSIDNGGSCTVQLSSGGVDPANATIPASGSVTFPYMCTFASNPTSSSGTNSATATWNAATYFTPDGSSVPGTAGYAFTAPTTVKGRCFTATDAFNGGSPLTLGVACIAPNSWTADPGNNLANFQESLAGSTYTFTYSRTIHAPGAGTCVTYANTASFTTTDSNHGSNGASVQVCAYQAPLTIGYWGNHLDKTGQSDCSGLPNGTGCSNNGPWAKTYLPQPLGPYSVNSVARVAAVIAANNCSNASSSSQNAVGCLAAQLLAAELNVAYASNSCIVTIAHGINSANAFLNSGTADGVTGVNYTGPTGNYSGISAAQRAEALVLKNELVNYNQGGGC